MTERHSFSWMQRLTLSAVVLLAALAPFAASAQSSASLAWRTAVNDSSIASSTLPTVILPRATPSRASVVERNSGPIAAPSALTTRQADRDRPLAVTPADRDHVGAGNNVAMMAVGVGAIITGSIVGGPGGSLIAVGGAVVGLVGLYHYVR